MRQAVDVKGKVRKLARGWVRAALRHSAHDVINSFYPHSVTSDSRLLPPFNQWSDAAFFLIFHRVSPAFYRVFPCATAIAN